MPRALFIPLLALLLLPLAARAEEIVTTTDGRQLLLRNDGRFQFLTGQQRQVPANPYLSNSNPYLGNAAPTRSSHVAPASVSVPGVAAPAAPVAPVAATAKTEEKRGGLMGILDGWIGEKKSKKPHIRK